MRTTILATLAAAGVAWIAPTASAGLIRTMQFDVNAANITVRDGTGAPSPFNGVTHTGSVSLAYNLNITRLETIAFFDPDTQVYTPASFTGGLTDFILTFDLSNGNVTGGNLVLAVNGGAGGGGDTYTADLGPFGRVTEFVGGGFILDALTREGQFSDADFAGVPIADFFQAQQGGGDALPGAVLSFRFAPTAQGAGTADAEIFVTNIPAPATLALLGTVLMMGGRRRR